MELSKLKKFSLEELQRLWGVDSSLVTHWLLEGDLCANAWVPLMSAYELQDVVEDRVVRRRKKLIHFEDYISLSRHHCRRLIRTGRIYMREFCGNACRCMFALPDEANDLVIDLRDLVILEEECQRFEKLLGINRFEFWHTSQNLSDEPIKCSNQNQWDSSFKMVLFEGKKYLLGDKQAKVMQLLNDAANNGEAWQSGKRLLEAAGSQSYSLSNVFKRNPVWRRWILSDGRGKYRLDDVFLSRSES